MTRPALSLDAAASLTIDTEPWLSCDDCFDQVDLHIESLVAGARELTPPFRAHLLGCPACFEEARTLIVLAAREARVSASASLSRLDRAVGGIHD